jgi:catechol 2,3-dioxygenase-like lactoylglutathione lyase family enzyme
MTGNILSTNHVGFTVTDIGATTAMFADLFGYERVSLGGRNPQGVARLTGVADADIIVAHLRHPDLIGIELIEYRKPDAKGRIEGRPCDRGYTHLTFDVRDLDILVQAASRYGLVPVGEAVGNPLKGARVVYLRDQDGINIELIQPAPAQA